MIPAKTPCIFIDDYDIPFLSLPHLVSPTLKAAKNNKLSEQIQSTYDQLFLLKVVKESLRIEHN
jgi:hypothetical protein